MSKGWSRRIPPNMSDEERIKKIKELRKRRFSFADIGVKLGMSANGVMKAYRRGTDPNYTPEPRPPRDDDW